MRKYCTEILLAPYTVEGDLHIGKWKTGDKDYFVIMVESDYEMTFEAQQRWTLNHLRGLSNPDTTIRMCGTHEDWMNGLGGNSDDPYRKAWEIANADLVKECGLDRLRQGIG